jgi:acetyl-CoA acetyltransferase
MRRLLTGAERYHRRPPGTFGAVTELSDAAIAGVYVSEQGDLAARSQPDLYWECVQGALADGGLTLADVDGLIGPAPEGFGVRHALPGAAVADVLGHPLRFHAATGVGAASQAAGVGLAALAVAHGLADVVVVPTAAAGASTGYTAADRNAAVEHMAKLGSPFEAVLGTTRVADFAMVARRHMHEYGTTSEQLAAVAVAQRHSATLHPRAVMGPKGDISVEQVLASRMMAAPLHLLDCCIVNQGGGCVVVTSRERVAAAGLHPPVVLLGWGEGHGYLDPNSAPSLTSFSGRVAAETAFRAAGVTHDDVDVAGISDHFTISVITELEDAGFCAKGEGGPFVADGALALGGRLPTNTHGGYLSGTHAASCALFTLIELVVQLRGEAGPRQVSGAAVAFACGVGGVSQAHYAAVLGRG